MRSKGEGSIYRRKDGLWVGRMMVDGVRKSVYGKTRQEAAEKLAGLKADVLRTG